MARVVDLSHTVEHGLVTYPGLPSPVVEAFFDHEASRGRYAPGTEFHIGRMELVTNTGTYLDAPFHRFRDGADVAALPLERLVDLPGRVVDAPAGARRIGPEALPDVPLAGHAVLFRTGWSRHFATARYAEDPPFLAAGLARELVRREVALVGIDALNADDTADGERPVHTDLLRAGIPLVEHLTRLDALPATGFRFTAAPLAVRGLGSFPVRAFAILG